MPAASVPTLATAAAASAASLAYIAARTLLPYDARFVASVAVASRRHTQLQRRDQLNLFYTLESIALEPSTAGLTFLVCREVDDGHGEEEEDQDDGGARKGGARDGPPRKRRQTNTKQKEKSWTFKETYEIVLRYAGWLRNVMGVEGSQDSIAGSEKPEGGQRRREVVALDFTNTPMFVFLWFAVWSLGAVPAFVNCYLGRRGFTQSVRTTAARVVIVEDRVWRTLAPSDPAGEGEMLVEMERELAPSADGGGAAGVKIVPFDQKVRSSMAYQPRYRAPDAVRANTQSRDAAILISTSGTTGPPKQAITSWAKLQGGGRFTANWLSLRPATHKHPDRVYCCMPLYHSSAAILGIVNCLMNTTTVILGHRFSTTGFWPEVRETRATVIQYVGEMCRYLVSCPVEADPDRPGQNLDRRHNVRMAFGNGLQPDVWTRFKDRFGIETIAEFYAATESMYAVWNLSRNDLSAGAVGRAGLLGSLMTKKVACVVQVDFEDETPVRDIRGGGLCVQVPRGEPGELLYKLDENDIKASFQGYFGDETSGEKKIIRNVRKQGDAWFRTGDVMRWDTEGRWWFVDRLGDTFRWKSENVSTAAVGQELGMHPDILEANVYGVRVPGHEGRAGCAAVTLADISPDDHVVVEALMAEIPTFLSTTLPRYSVPLFLRLVTRMQQTATLKQQKHVFRSEGLDLDKVEGEYGEEIWWLKGGRYVKFRREDWEQLVGGKVML